MVNKLTDNSITPPVNDDEASMIIESKKVVIIGSNEAEIAQSIEVTSSFTPEAVLKTRH